MFPTPIPVIDKESSSDVLTKNTRPKANITPRKNPLRRSSLAKKLLIKGENPRKFEELRAKISEEIQPASEIEGILCEKFISAVWNHNRTLEVVRNTLNKQNQIERSSLYSSNGDQRKRIRNIRKVSFGPPHIQKLLVHRMALEKTILKMLERIREEQDRRMGIKK